MASTPLLGRDCRVRTSRRIGRIFDSGRGVFSSASSWRVSTTPLSPANWTSLAWSCTTSMIFSSTSAKRSVAWCNFPLHELLRVSQKVACPTCALICDWRRHWNTNQPWLQLASACTARLFQIVRSQWHGGAWSWSSTSTFMSDGTAWVWLGLCIGWLFVELFSLGIVLFVYRMF